MVSFLKRVGELAGMGRFTRYGFLSSNSAEGKCLQLCRKPVFTLSTIIVKKWLLLSLVGIYRLYLTTIVEDSTILFWSIVRGDLQASSHLWEIYISVLTYLFQYQYWLWFELTGFVKTLYNSATEKGDTADRNRHYFTKTAHTPQHIVNVEIAVDSKNDKLTVLQIQSLNPSTIRIIEYPFYTYYNTRIVQIWMNRRSTKIYLSLYNKFI